MLKNRFYQDNYKKIGIQFFDQSNTHELTNQSFRPYIKIFYLPTDSKIKIDFQSFKIDKPSLCFVNSNQYIEIEYVSDNHIPTIYYNRDFYCIQIHDKEVSCDGLLFNNIFGKSVVELTDSNDEVISGLFNSIIYELNNVEDSYEEMLKVLLKQIIILATRIWKNNNIKQIDETGKSETNLFRDFSRIIEIHFKSKHNVSDYAELLGVSAKTLSTKFKKWNLDNPNEYIKDRILLEAKRLIIYSSLSIKEIAYSLGYDDPAYFNRVFTQKMGCTPAAFKKMHNT